MRYARDIIELMEAYPGRAFPMRYFVNMIQVGMVGLERGTVRRQVTRVLTQLSEMGLINVISSGPRDRNATYSWVIKSNAPARQHCDQSGEA